MEMFRAVIENNISPTKDGRVQVRIFGIHDADKNIVKTEHLPWAEVMQSTAFGFSSGVGFSSIPNIGTWVFVTLDHNNPNMPIVMGAISGNSAEKTDLEFPLEDRLGEEDQNRLQRVENLDKTIHKKININIDKVNGTDGITGARVVFNEPSSLSDKSIYPDNAVIETKSGHVIEIDDTPLNEKIRIYHRTGSYIDLRPDGSMITKTVSGKDNFYIHSENINTHIEKCVKTHIDKNIDEIVGGYVKRYIGGNLSEHIAGLFKLDADGNIHFVGDLKVDGSIECTGDVSDSEGNLSSLRAKHDANVTIYNGHTHGVSRNTLAVPTGATQAPDPKSKFVWSSIPKDNGFVCV